ncbi:DUF427 domain-containing protein [Arthrobacter bambusae]|uniref:DUF427 domain-containing protein n=1 Tax=Arthrobacter bambusae TaxID=1338426 RepID=UPI00278A0CF4|nr:DUF427 domain-containing protein [Arthrobacter bambusae]MDQ0213100.1 uncharacterized protein (DUF427 family) [Arthrobacter bambusae]MDQ0237450.1 uncharacterized protein (DUF427 family) [Arthrobacter bambusae]
MMSAQHKSYQAIWNGTVVAESDRTVEIEGNQYFPPGSIKPEYFRPSGHTSVCFWKGTASYYTLEVDGRTNRDAAWYYPAPSPAAREIKDHVAFWKGVRILEAGKSEPADQTAPRGLLARILGRT